MPKFKKKPIIVDAYQVKDEITIHTLEGNMRAKKGDWIIIGVEGELYPCKKSVFEKIYEPIKEDNVRNNNRLRHKPKYNNT